MTYNPDFSRNPKGNFNIDNNFVSVKNGSEAYLLEDELNEMQWIQNEQRAQLIRATFNSGIPYDTLFISDDNTNKDETIYVKGYGNADLNSNAILLSIKDYIPININGYFIKLAGTYKKDTIGALANNNNILIKLPEPPITVPRYDLVFLEAWFEEIDVNINKEIKTFGGMNNKDISNFEVDSRLSVETTRRIQLKWNITTTINAKTLLDSTVKPLNNTLNSRYVLANTIQGKTYSKDPNLYVSINNNGIVDGTFYAIPLFSIYRLPGKNIISKNDIKKIDPIKDVNNHTHDERYYRKDEIDKMFNGFGFISGTTLPNIIDRKPNTLYFKIK
jgi:hypothetical protein